MRRCVRSPTRWSQAATACCQSQTGRPPAAGGADQPVRPAQGPRARPDRGAPPRASARPTPDCSGAWAAAPRSASPHDEPRRRPKVRCSTRTISGCSCSATSYASSCAGASRAPTTAVLPLRCISCCLSYVDTPLHPGRRSGRPRRRCTYATTVPSSSPSAQRALGLICRERDPLDHAACTSSSPITDASSWRA